LTPSSIENKPAGNERPFQTENFRQVIERLNAPK